MTKVSVIIKALNEEENIAKAIESSLAAVAPYQGEVIVADSGSTDRTVEIASQYPIILAQLGDPTERCCGISPQLGYQHSRGQYVYILDGDMDLDAAFLALAIERLDADARIAGVGGFVREMRIANIEFESRLKRQLRRQVKHESRVDCLNGGGLYRRAAIEEVSYISDRNLHTYEEFDLGVRLRAKDWELIRLDDHAADHYGYRFNTYRLIWHRARSGYILGAGDILRAAISGRFVGEALARLPGLRVALFVWLYWAAACVVAAIAPTLLLKIATLAAAAVLPVAVMTARSKGSLQTGLHSVMLWHLNAVGLLIGFLRPRQNPIEPINSRLLKTGQTGSDRTESAPFLTARR